MNFLTLTLLVVFSCVWSAEGHGRLLEPPGRASKWRFGYPMPPDYDDNQCFCGGISALWNQNGGKCGVCGDSFSEPQPRSHEVGGKFFTPIIVRNYTKGQTIDVTVELTTNHDGYFEFRLCPNNDFTKESTQECLDKNLLQFADGSGTRFNIPAGTGYSAKFNLKVKLPATVTCFQCLFQWHYFTASNTGTCPDGTEKKGCGPQEVFRGCADVAIK